MSTEIDKLIQPGDEPLDREQRIHLQSLAENVITLLWSLGEASSKALQAVNAAGVEMLLVKCIGAREMVGKVVAVAAGASSFPAKMRPKLTMAAQAAYSLSHDNRPFRIAVLRLGALETLIGAARGEALIVDGVGSKKGKGKGKASGANGQVAEEDVLFRLLVCGAC